MKRKNILILGSARSGKSTLATMINKKYNYSIVSIDSFVSALRDAFPELGITHSNTENKFRLLPIFVYSYMKKIINEYPDNMFVLEGWHVYPNEIVKLFNDLDVKIICLGYTKISCDEVVSLIRSNERENSYTKNMTDNEVKELVKHHIEYSKILKEQCVNNDVPFYDTSYNREEILEEIIFDLMN